MIKNKLFILFWPLLALIGIPLTAELFQAMVSPHTYELGEGIYIYFVVAGYVPLYIAFAFCPVLWYFYCWYHEPSKKIMFKIMFAAWIVCGYPGMLIPLAILEAMRH